MGNPAKCTAIRAVAGSGRSAGSRLSVAGSMSANSTAAPWYRAQLALATKDSDDVTARSSGPTPAAAAAPCRPAVPLENATAKRAPTRPATASSNASTAGPWVSQSPRSTSTTAATSSSSTLWRP